MTDLRKAAEKVVMAWDKVDFGTLDNEISPQMEALRKALAQPEQVLTAKVVVTGREHDPVACKHEWVRTRAMLSGDWFCIHCCEWEHNTEPPKREWVGLTDTEKSELEDKYKHIETGLRHDADLIAETEAKLKEKNG